MDGFDFLFGTWDVHNRRLKDRLVGSREWEEFSGTAECRSVLGGAGNVDEIRFPDGTMGLTLRLWDPEREVWSLNWTTNESGRFFPPVVGGFRDGRGVFYGDDAEGGMSVRVRFIWSEMTATSARWEQAFSTDGGNRWETNWIMELTRTG